MTCPTCGAAKDLKEHYADGRLVNVLVCPVCLDTQKIEQPTFAEVEQFRAGVDRVAMGRCW